MRSVSIVGIGQSPVGELWSRSARQIASDAITAAMREANVDSADALYLGNMLSGSLLDQEHLATLVADYCGLGNVEAAKIEAAVALGAVGGANYREEGWHKKLGKETGGFDVVIDGAGGDGFAQLVAVCRPGGRIGIYGGTRGTLGGLSPQQLFFRQLSIHGSTMGSDKDFAEMVAFVNQHQIVPVVDSVFDLADVNAAIARMDRGEQFGKIVLRI